MFKRWYVWLVIVVVLIPAVYLVEPWPWSVGGGELGPMMDRPECAHATMFADSSGHQVPRPVSIAISGSIAEIPEYHDCQRLVLQENETRRYGPLVAIYVRIGVRNVRNPLGFVPATTVTMGPMGGAATGILNAAGGFTFTVNVNVSYAVPTNATEDGTQQSVVTILNYGKGSYDPLQIGEGFSCLYVYDGGDKTWHAKIQRVPTDKDCLRPLSDWPDAKPLSVNAIPDPNPAPATRWDWDAAHNEHFMGVPCGTSWCEVYHYGVTGFGSSRLDPGFGKGWRDEQVLAEETNLVGHPDNLIPGASAGNTVPIGDLASPEYEYNDGEIFGGVWIPVARVSLSQPSPVYESKYKYRGGPAPYGKSIVSFCKGSKQECLGFWPPVLFINKCNNAGDEWWARVESPAGTKYRCVIRRKPMDTTAPLPPGMVRWRWKLQDEGMWVRCPGGCCEKT